MYHPCVHVWCRCLEPESDITDTFVCIRPVVPTAHSLHQYVSSSEVCSRTGRPPITTLIKQRQLKLFGYVARAEQAEDHNRVLQASLNPPGKVVTGDGREDALVRPSKELSVTILNISCQPSSAYRQAQDRPIWWKTVETAMLT